MSYRALLAEATPLCPDTVRLVLAYVAPQDDADAAAAAGDIKSLKWFHAHIEFNRHVALHAAIAAGQLAAVQELCAQMQVERAGVLSCELLCACAHGQSEIVKWFCASFEPSAIELYESGAASIATWLGNNPSLGMWLYEQRDGKTRDWDHFFRYPNRLLASTDLKTFQTMCDIPQVLAADGAPGLWLLPVVCNVGRADMMRYVISHFFEKNCQAWVEAEWYSNTVADAIYFAVQAKDSEVFEALAAALPYPHFSEDERMFVEGAVGESCANLLPLYTAWRDSHRSV